MKVEVTMTLDLGNEETAKNIFESLRVDDDGYVQQTLSGNKIEMRTKTGSPGSVRQTVEDYLSCLVAASSSISSLNSRPDEP